MKFFMRFHKSCGQVIPQLSMYIIIYLRQQFFDKIFLREPCFSLSGWVWKYIPPELLHNTLLVVDFFPCRTTFCCHC